MVAAVALFAAASCNKELPQEQLPVGETVVYTASVDGADTKAVLNETTKKSEWVAGDAITVHDGTKGWTFTADKAGQHADFSNSEGFGEYRPVMAVYPKGTYNVDITNKSVTATIPTNQSSVKNTYNNSAALAIAYSENNSFAFKNAHSLVKFTIKSDNIKGIEFYGNNEEKLTGNVNVSLKDDKTIKSVVAENTWVELWANESNWCFSNGSTYYAVIAPTKFANGVSINLKLSNDVNYEKVKTTTKSFELNPSTILNIGEIEVPAKRKIYLNAGGTGLWDQAGAVFEAWTWGAGKDAWYTFKKGDDNVYYIEVPFMTDHLHIMRRSSSHNKGSWDSNQRWNQTNDINLGGKNMVTITGWDEDSYQTSTR